MQFNVCCSLNTLYRKRSEPYNCFMETTIIRNIISLKSRLNIQTKKMLGKANFHAEIADDITSLLWGCSCADCLQNYAKKSRRVSWKKLATFKIELVILNRFPISLWSTFLKKIHAVWFISFVQWFKTLQFSVGRFGWANQLGLERENLQSTFFTYTIISIPTNWIYFKI